MYKKLNLFLMILICCTVPATPLRAQTHRQAAFNQLIHRLTVNEQKTIRTLRNRLKRALTQAQKQTNSTAPKTSFFAAPRQTVFLLQDAGSSHRTPFFASGFLIREVFKGKNYVWGVTAKHITDLFDASFEAVFYVNGQAVRCPVQAVFAGAQHGIDLTLLKVDTPAHAPLEPLALGQNPQEGEILQSYGYTRGLFYYSGQREVLAVSPQQIITPYAFAAHHPAAGYCGSPLLNAKGEVAGIHNGSPKNKNQSVAVPVAQLRTLLAAYRGLPQGDRALVFNGRYLGALRANQTVLAVYAKKDNKIFASMQWPTLPDGFTQPQAIRPPNPAQLQQFLNWQGADEINVLVFEEPPHYFQPQADLCRQTLYRYDLTSGAVSARTFTALLPL